MKLNEINRKIDKIDRELLVLLQERMGLSLRSKKFQETSGETEREEDVLERMDRYSMQSTRVTPEEVEEKLSEVPFLTCGAYDDDCVYVYVEREGQLAFYWAHFSNWDGDLFPDIEVRDGDNIYAFHDHSCAGAFDCEGSLRSFIEVRA